LLPSLTTIASRLRFRQLALLVALDEHGSLHRASVHLGLTQPGLTKALREIEETFGMSLFQRTSKGMQANEFGKCVIRYGRLARADLGNLREEMAGVLRGTGGRVAVGSITGALHSVLIRALTHLRSREASLSIRVQEGTSLELLEQIEQGRLDLALCRTTVASRPEQFRYEALCEEKLAIAVGPRHPLAKARRVTWAQLAKYRWIFYPSTLPIYSVLEQEFRQAGLPMPLNPTETSSPFVTMLMLKEDPRLVALMSAATMKFCVEHGIACELPLAIQSRHEDYGIVTRLGYSPTPAVSLLMETLRQIAREILPANLQQPDAPD
jgi:DNA-binding transcriptional LysR family regulator